MVDLNVWGEGQQRRVRAQLRPSIRSPVCPGCRGSENQEGLLHLVPVFIKIQSDMNTRVLIFIMMMMMMMMASVSLFLWHFCIKVFLFNCHKGRQEM